MNLGPKPKFSGFQGSWPEKPKIDSFQTLAARTWIFSFGFSLILDVSWIYFKSFFSILFRLFNPNHNPETTIDLWRKPWYWQEPFPLVDYLLSQVCIPARGGTRTDWVSHYHCLLLLRTQNARLLALISTLFPLSLIINLNVMITNNLFWAKIWYFVTKVVLTYCEKKLF